jgi:hypothetical protein
MLIHNADMVKIRVDCSCNTGSRSGEITKSHFNQQSIAESTSRLERFKKRRSTITPKRINTLLYCILTGDNAQQKRVFCTTNAVFIDVLNA